MGDFTPEWESKNDKNEYFDKIMVSVPVIAYHDYLFQKVREG